MTQFPVCVAVVLSLGPCVPEPEAGKSEHPSPLVEHEVSARPIDFAKVQRSIGKLPALQASEPLYGLFLFGLNGEHSVWALLDKSEPTSAVYDLLYLDRNANGDLTEPRERFEAKKGDTSKRMLFEVGDFVDPGSKAVHEDFTVTWAKASIRYQMSWRGQKRSKGCFGPYRKTYQQFSPSPEEAPVFVPGWDRPFEFQHWTSGTLRRGETNDFKVFVGNRGDRTGAFSCVDDKFLPLDESPLATLIYQDLDGKEQRYQVKLTERC